MHKVIFFLPNHDYKLVHHLTSIEEFTLHHPQYVWTWSTYYRLKNKGYDVTLTDVMPSKGIVVVNSLNLPLFIKPSDEVMFISLLADSPPAFYAQINVSQNPWQFRNYPNVLQFPVWRHIAHWPQPGIIARDGSRGDLFENIAFFGHRDQMDPYLLSEEFAGELQKLGLRFTIADKNFNDYSGVDGVIAVREFGNNLYLNKPYSKLVNAWLAQVPIVVGAESSFRSIKKSDLDFIAVHDRPGLIKALKTLRDDVVLRRKMVGNGVERSKEFTEEKIVDSWGTLLFGEAQSYYARWVGKSKLSKALFYSDQLISRGFRSIKNRILH